jgi:hypothetical protein
LFGRWVATLRDINLQARADFLLFPSLRLHLFSYNTYYFWPQSEINYNFYLGETDSYLSMRGLEADASPASAETQALPGQQPHRDAILEPSGILTHATVADSDLVQYRIEYVDHESGSVMFDGKLPELDTSKEPPVFEYVNIQLSGKDTLAAAINREDIFRTDQGKGHAYINILSPAVAEALRCVVDYFPDLDFSGNLIKIREPYSVLVFFKKELTEYRERVARTVRDDSSTCPNRWAANHIAIIQGFVKEQVQEAVNAERTRHARGYATFDMLWLLYKPGSDVYFDAGSYGEHDPFVLSNVRFDLVNGATNSCRLWLWNMDADSTWVGLRAVKCDVPRFAGEKKIPELRAYPCEYRTLSATTLSPASSVPWSTTKASSSSPPTGSGPLTRHSCPVSTYRSTTPSLRTKSGTAFGTPFSRSSKRIEKRRCKSLNQPKVTSSRRSYEP